MFFVFGASSFVLHPLLSLMHLPSHPAPPSCLSHAKHQIQAPHGPVFDVQHMIALPYPPKTKNTPPGHVFCVWCIPISSPKAKHKQHASGACLLCSAHPQPSPTRRTQVTPPRGGVFCVRCVPSHSPSAEHKQHTPGGVSFVFGASPFIPTQHVPLLPHMLNSNNTPPWACFLCLACVLASLPALDTFLLVISFLNTSILVIAFLGTSLLGISNFRFIYIYMCVCVCVSINFFQMSV